VVSVHVTYLILILFLIIYLSNSLFINIIICVGINDLGIIKTDDDMATRDKGYKDHGFNALVSLRLGNYRETLPDTRHKL